MRFAYADPPYPGMAHLYKDHPDYGGEVDHKELIERLVAEFPDGWMLSTAATSLQDLLAISPKGVRVLPWCVTDSPYCPPRRLMYSWQPLLLFGGRNPSAIVKDFLVSYSPKGLAVKDMDLAGQKPEVYCFWVFRCLGARQGDELVDLFPGSGAVGRAWDRFQRQAPLPSAPTASHVQAALREEVKP